MKIRPAGAELFHAERRTDGPTDITKLMVPFLQFCERVQKNSGYLSLSRTIPESA